jgi:AmmeMemoRadiSam system protein A
VGKVVFCGVAPHPPIVLPEIGKNESVKVSKTYNAMEKLAARAAESGAEVIVIISPHGSVFRDGIAINGSELLTGDLKTFNSDLEFEYNNDLELVQSIGSFAGSYGIVTVEIDDALADDFGVTTKLDHGVLVPMYFFDKAAVDLPMVSISMSLLPFEELYAFGFALRKAVEASDKKVAVIASSDMSHRLIPDAPAGYSPQGKVFDQKIVELIRNKDFKGIINIDRNMAIDAGECGLRSIIMMLGALDGQQVDTEVLSYEGPFGVGYMVAALQPGKDSGESLLEEIFQERREKLETKRAGESALVALARQALETYVRDDRKIVPDTKADPVFNEKAGVFVSLKKHGQLRGCIGTILPTTPNIGAEIVNNAISAGTGDPRFEPVDSDELDDLVYSVDVLKAPEPVKSIGELDVKRYGVIVRSGRRSGLLLPNLEGVNTVEEQVAIARQKAGIAPGEHVQLERFEVIRYN